MRSGRLCSSGGRQVRSSIDQPLARFNAVISRDSAPQAITSTRPEDGTADKPGSARRPARRNHRLGGLHGDGSIAAVRVGTDGFAELLVERRTADQHDELVAQALLLERVDDDLYVRHRGRQQRRHAKDVRLVQLNGRQILLDRVVDAEVDDLEAGALKHHRHQVLADIVDVALDGADDDLANRLDAGLGQQGPQDLHATLHRVRRQQHLGTAQDAGTEIDPDDAHAFDQRVVQHLLGRPAAPEEDPGRLLDLLLEAVVEIVVNLFGQLLIVQAVEIKFLVLAISHRCSPGLLHASSLNGIVQARAAAPCRYSDRYVSKRDIPALGAGRGAQTALPPYYGCRRSSPISM